MKGMDVSPGWLPRLNGQGGRLGPWRFLAWGVGLFALKFLLDRLVATLLFNRDWSPANYLIPNESYSLFAMPPGDRRFYFVMLLVAIPFVVIGVTLTFRRLRDAAIPRWLVVLFFVPFVNLLFFGVLSLIQTAVAPKAAPAAEIPIAHRVPSLSDPSPQPTLTYGHDEPNAFQRFCSWLLPAAGSKSAWVAALLPVPFTLGIVFFSAIMLQDYGWGVFIGLPFIVGMIAAVLHGYSVPRTFAQSISVGFFAAIFSGVAVLLSALEGAVCLIMLAPLAAPIVLLGAAMGHAIQSRPLRMPGISNTLWGMVVLLPVLIGAESRLPHRPLLHCTVTSVEIDAPPIKVWRHVVEFTEVPRPDDWFFRAGIAYPIRARIEGSGVGAIRYCEFSTGPFIEPITAWDDAKLLKFSVTSNPPPMKEWSPFEIEPPHLQNFLISHGGQFKLIELPGGRTRLEGTTWYEHGLFPEAYWRWWSDHIIGRIHQRVLNHVKQTSESDTMAAP